jgi:hypothetical protein
MNLEMNKKNELVRKSYIKKNRRKKENDYLKEYKISGQYKIKIFMNLIKHEILF